MNIKKIYNEYKSYFEEKLLDSLTLLTDTEKNLQESMKYSLLCGGKRIRPVIMLMTADVLGVNREKVLPYALAIEHIHTYSLIHDDLPAMDNDDLRRGKPTNHKVFGEDMAILAGDGLLNRAFEIVFNNATELADIKAGRILSNYSGAFGMVGGQAYDIKNTNYPQNLDTLKTIHKNKTGKLITACTIIPACFANDLHFDKLKTYGEKLGLLFQITDDILDSSSTVEEMGKNVNKDDNANKLTYVTLLGVEKSKEFANITCEEAIFALDGVENNQNLVNLAKYVLNRTN